MDDALGIALAANLPYTGLRGFDVDARLWRYVPLQLALKERVVPLTLVADELKVAAAHADPDLSALRTHFPNLRIGVVIAPAAEIDAALARVQGPQDA
ncbi:hypothetical protein GKE82_18015 [Conexibacter sp. W3-3-2]|uniref:Type II secretion system protein GspE N-terminal domain-containing protein n=1 Tax=Paraconexibacter algicola TaxID=2133960 RepID=A0A2T4UKN5_9ACTN|nr:MULTISPECIES: hypothetical protein [Solirubrobacterales]MTD46128.1 hypothetical protein [Conexibacter sp. W3-3-2]PTL59803.1 hypothetical protein C7Y72_09145 [Paraconexibacter algicola]